MELEKLSEESLTRQPEEVFDILCKLGEGSYGSVFKALHKESRQILAIKQVPVDKDLQEIIKEISIMQQCDSPYVVKYYGSYFKNTDLWIVMEYCGAGSVLDIMKLRGIHHGLPKGIVKSLTEEEIATVLCDTLKGLEYLHLRKKIHRDIKAGNILLNSEGHAKLADFGVAGQLTDTMAKRNTMIGTPFWMAPEVIQEIGYDCAADIWSLGITALEMAEGKAPYGDIHPMRAIFMIPSKPPPSFSEPDKWSSQFIDFVTRCLVKNPEERASSSELLQHEFIVNAKSFEILENMIYEAQTMKDELQDRNLSNSEDSGTIIPGEIGDESGTMIQHATLVNPKNGDTYEIGSSLGTMVINDDTDENDEDTMKRHVTSSSSDYRPAFLDHFDKKPNSAQSQNQPENKAANKQQQPAAAKQLPAASAPAAAAVAPVEPLERAAFQRQFDQIAGRQPVYHSSNPAQAGDEGGGGQPDAASIQRSIAEGDFDILKFLGFEELTSRMGNLDQEMEREIDDLRMRYHAKRQPILDAIDQKRKRQQNF